MFKKYIDAGFPASELLPIMPPDAPLGSGGSYLAAKRGKIPGAYKAAENVWTGLGEWTTRTFDDADAARWESWPSVSVGLQARRYPCGDIDVGVEEVAQFMEGVLFEGLGATIVRGRANSARRLLPYRLADGEPAFPKWRVAFTLAETGDTKHAIELLGSGQQYLIEGMHPSNVSYEWRDGWSLDRVTSDQLPTVTFAQLVNVRDDILLAIEAVGGVVIGTPAEALASDPGSRLKIGRDEHMAHDLDELIRALSVLPNEFDYDGWVRMSAAIKAGAGGDERCFGAYEEWCHKNPIHTPGDARRLWDSIHDSNLGARDVFGLAREHGFVGGVSEFEALGDEELSAAELAEITPPPAPTKRASRMALPIIQLIGGDIGPILEETEAALIRADKGYYCFGTSVVKTILATNIPTFKEGTTTGVRLSRATPQSLYVDLTKSARYVKYDGRSKSLVDHDCPTDVAASYLALGAWGLPHLTGLINAPTLRPDGSFLDMPGYDRGTGLLYIGDGTVYPGLPRKRERLVTLKDAKAALPVLDELLCGFPFVSKADKAVALSAILTACIRRSLPSAPLHAFTAPTPGTGKSLLVDMIAMMTEGRKAAVLSPGENAAEFEKRLNAALLSGDLIIAIDNIARPLEGELLCSALTQDVVRIRPLGETTLVAVPSNSMILANGNNLRIVGDMTRRAIMCTIDAGCERPEQREFPRTPVEMVQADRGRYVMAALTVLKAYKDQTCLQDYVPAFGSFTAWSTWVRGALIWVGAGDPCETMETIRANDATRITHQAVVAAWWAAFADKEVLAKELCGDVDMDTLAMSPLHEALTAAVNGRGGLTARQVGGWLSAKENTIVDGLKIVKGWHSAQKVATWRLFKL